MSTHSASLIYSDIRILVIRVRGTDLDIVDEARLGRTVGPCLRIGLVCSSCLCRVVLGKAEGVDGGRGVLSQARDLVPPVTLAPRSPSLDWAQATGTKVQYSTAATGLTVACHHARYGSPQTSYEDHCGYQTTV